MRFSASLWDLEGLEGLEAWRQPVVPRLQPLTAASVGCARPSRAWAGLTVTEDASWSRMPRPAPSSYSVAADYECRPAALSPVGRNRESGQVALVARNSTISRSREALSTQRYAAQRSDPSRAWRACSACSARREEPDFYEALTKQRESMRLPTDLRCFVRALQIYS